MSTSFHNSQTFQKAKEQQNKDYEFFQRDIQIKNRIESQNQAKLAQMKEKENKKANWLSKNREKNIKQNEEKIQKIKDKLNINNTKKSPSPTKLFTPNLISSNTSLYKTALPRSPSFHSKTKLMINRTRNKDEQLRQSYESEIYNRLSSYTKIKNEHLQQIKNKFNSHNCSVNDKMNQNIIAKSIGTDKLKNEIELQNAHRLNAYNKYLHEKQNSLNIYNCALYKHGVEVRMRKNELRSDDQDKLEQVINNARFGSYENHVPNINFQLSPNQLKRIERRKEAKEKFDENQKKEMKRMQERGKQILNNEFSKFNKICQKELNNDNKKDKIHVGAIRKQEKEDYENQQTQKQLDNLKNTAIYKHISN